MTGILVYSEDRSTALELITAARSASKTGAPEISVALLYPETETSSNFSALSVEGVTKIFFGKNNSSNDHSPEAVTDALEQIVLESKPDFILVDATKHGKEIAPRLAARLRLGCITDAQDLELRDGEAKASRVVWGGNAISNVKSRGGTVITIAPRSYERSTGQSSPQKKELNFTAKTRSSRVVGKKSKQAGEVNIKDAQAIVSAGRGFKKKEDLAILDDLASTLHAVIGASRPLTSDLAWMPESRQIGLSGTTVKPKLYVAVGISGQIQHLTGMRDSKLIVAINSDKNAPIFSECDYGIVGDLYQVVPALAKSLRSKTGH